MIYSFKYQPCIHKALTSTTNSWFGTFKKAQNMIIWARATRGCCSPKIELYHMSYIKAHWVKVFYVTFSNKLKLKCAYHGLHVTFLDVEITVVDSITDINFLITFTIFVACMSDLSDNIPAYILTVQFYLNFWEELNAQ